MTGTTATAARIDVRRAAAGDADMLADLRRAWCAETECLPDEDFRERFRDWFAAESGRRVTWLSSVLDRPTGMVNLSIFPRMPKPGRPPAQWGYIGNMFVLAEHRGCGIGRALLGAALDYADTNRLVRVVLAPSERSVPFYQRAGFRSADELMLRSHGGRLA